MISKLLLSICFFFVFTFHSTTQISEPESIIVRANWNSGEMVRYEFTESVMIYNEGVLIDEQNHRTVFHIDVASVQGNTGYILLWQLVNTNAPLFDDEVLDDYMYGLLGNGIVVHTNRFGGYTYSSNLRDIHEQFQQAVQTLDNRAHWYNKGQLREQLNFYLKDYNLFEDLILRDFKFMHGLHGVQLVYDEEYTYDTWQQNPFGENVESTGTLLVNNFDSETSNIEVTNRVELHEKIENMHLSETQHYTINTSTGWILRVDLIDNMQFDEWSRERKVIIRRIPT